MSFTAQPGSNHFAWGQLDTRLPCRWWKWSLLVAQFTERKSCLFYSKVLIVNKTHYSGLSAAFKQRLLFVIWKHYFRCLMKAPMANCFVFVMQHMILWDPTFLNFWLEPFYLCLYLWVHRNLIFALRFQHPCSDIVCLLCIYAYAYIHTISCCRAVGTKAQHGVFRQPIAYSFVVE